MSAIRHGEVRTALQFPNVWRGSELARAGSPGRATGFPALDRELPGGGWPVAAVTEILHPGAGIGELSLLLPALVRLSQEGRPQLWIAPPRQLHAPALARAGIDLSRLIVAEPAHRRDLLWTVEQALRSGSCGAVLAWPAALPDARPLQYAETRRLQIATEGSTAITFVFRPPGESGETSAAALRLALSPCPDARLAVQVLKRRGAGLAAPIILDPGTAAPAAAVRPFHPAAALQAASVPQSPAPSSPLPQAAPPRPARELRDALAGDPLPAAPHRINSAGEFVS